MPNYSVIQASPHFEEIYGQNFTRDFKEEPLYVNLDNQHYTTRYDNKHIYEFTITFGRYWSLIQITRYGIVQAINYIIRGIFKEGINFTLDYSIEYHENGRQHIHGHILADEDIDPAVQGRLVGTLNRKFGRTQWYQTENIDMEHVKTDKQTGEIIFQGKWSEYIRKEIIQNNQSGCIHGYSISTRY